VFPVEMNSGNMQWKVKLTYQLKLEKHREAQHKTLYQKYRSRNAA